MLSDTIAWAYEPRHVKQGLHACRHGEQEACGLLWWNEERCIITMCTSQDRQKPSNCNDIWKRSMVQNEYIPEREVIVIIAGQNHEKG